MSKNLMSTEDRKLMNEVCNPNPNVRIAKLFIAIGAALITLSIMCSCGLQNQIDELKQQNKKENVRLNNLESRIYETEMDLAQVNAQRIELESKDGDNKNSISALQSQAQSMLIQLAVLNGYTSIVAVYNPCGNQSSADEVFLKLSSGKYLASFSDSASGLNTRFSQLYDGTFQTTDATHCTFSVSGGGTVISNEHN